MKQQSKKRRVINLFFCFLFSILLVGLLFTISDKLNHQKNGFIRLIPSHAVLVENDFKLDGSSSYIAGFTNHHVYIGSYKNPNQVLDLNTSSGSRQTFVLTSLNTKLVWWTVKVEIDSPNIYLTDGISGVILHGRLGDTVNLHFFSTPVNFDEATVLCAASFILRTYNSKLKQNVLAKVNSGLIQIKCDSTILEQQVDGVFSTDGAMHYDFLLHKVAYVYFYRNQFICMDTNLKVLYRGHTIDTNSVAKLKIRTYDSGKSRTLAVPPLLINPNSCVNDDRLFVHSALLANNEEKKLFDQASVIDVYLLKNGHYENSFYLPEHNGHKISDFAIIGNKVIALYPDGIILAVLNLSYPK